MSYTGIDAWGHRGSGLLAIAGETMVKEPRTDEWTNVYKADNGVGQEAVVRALEMMEAMYVGERSTSAA